MTEDSRGACPPARYRDDAPLPQQYFDLATGRVVAAILDWTPEGEPIRTEGARFRDYLAAWEANRAMAQVRREAQRQEGR
jgi:hypothetical protein